MLAFDIFMVIIFITILTVLAFGWVKHLKSIQVDKTHIAATIFMIIALGSVIGLAFI